MTSNELLVLIIGMLLGMSACGVVFLLGLRIRNANKHEKRAKHKLASTQRNTTNRIYNALCRAAEKNADQHISVSKNEDNAEFGSSIKVEWVALPNSFTMCFVEIYHDSIALANRMGGPTKHERCGVDEEAIRRFIESLSGEVIRYHPV